MSPSPPNLSMLINESVEKVYPKNDDSENVQRPITVPKGQHVSLFSNSYWHDPVPSLELSGVCLMSPKPPEPVQLSKQVETYLNFFNNYFDPSFSAELVSWVLPVLEQGTVQGCIPGSVGGRQREGGIPSGSSKLLKRAQSAWLRGCFSTLN